MESVDIYGWTMSTHFVMSGGKNMFLDFLWLVVGLVLLVKGADFFVKGSSNIARFLKIPSLIIGLTLVSFGTSAPEASVSINAAINNFNDLSLGNIVGSNIFNTLFIIGISALFGPLVFSKDIKKYDILIMTGIYLVLMLFSFIITPYVLDLFESLTMLLLFVLYLVHLFIRSKNGTADISEEEQEEITKKKLIINIFLAAIGLASIIIGGDLVVTSASNISIEIGMSESLVGLTIVAVGTSLPELVTSVVATVKKENDIAVGNVIGSNIFNVIFILAFSSSISNINVQIIALFDILVMLLSAIIIILIAKLSNNVKKWHGILLILIYVAYLTYIVIRN